jgi:sugar phosphate isomerase/epimerase
MVFGSPGQRNLREGQNPDEAWRNAVEVFRGCVTEFEKRDVTLCIEPLATTETNFITTAEQGRSLIDEVGSPAVQLHLDVKAMDNEKTPIPEIIRASKGYARHFHANDPNLRGPGMGDTDFRPILEALNEIGYEGYLSVEVFDLEPGAEATARESIRYLRDLLG